MSDQVKYFAKLKGKSVLVVGGSSGIGYAVAEAAIEHGAYTIISSSRPAKVEAAVQSLTAAYPSAAARISGHACDLSDDKNLDANVLNLLGEIKTLDHIVYTAGEPIPPTPIAEATLDKLRSAGTVRYEAAVILIKHALKYLKKSPESSITLTTGVVTEKPIPNWSVIAGARSAVLGLGKALALDLRPIRVNTVAIGPVNTETWSHIPADKKEQMFEALAKNSATGRIADASDVAEAYLYCMKDRNVTGSTISSNGGSLLV